MAARTKAPYGSWKSPISADLVAGAMIRLGQMAVDGPSVYWVEMRPGEGGRCVIVRRDGEGRTADVNPAPFNARTRVHEYGGGAFATAGGVLWFSNFADQRLYRMAGAEADGAATSEVGAVGTPEPITPEGDLRYADAIVDPVRGRLICVREDHTQPGSEPENTLVAVAAAAPGRSGERGGIRVLVRGADFYSSPRLSPDGGRLAWLAWNHPNMPWDGTELWVAEIAPDGALREAERVAGGPNESIFQPEWSPDGVLHFVSDRTGWWNLYRRRGGRVEPLCERRAEFGLPQWVFGLSTYAFVDEKTILCTFSEDGRASLARLDGKSGELTPFATPFTGFAEIRVSRGRGIFAGSSPTAPTVIATIDPASGETEVLVRPNRVALEESALSVPEPITFPTSEGKSAHGYYYPPHNLQFVAGEEERPPLLVKIHGGPTSATSTTFNLVIQYWTSRGFAVLDVNYGGSTGFGREYRERLRGKWGIVDVDDCVNGALHLARLGKVDAERLAIDGGSAGGFTTLAALTFRDAFRAGASYYGVSDLGALAMETHKFESRYLDSMIGPYPQAKDVYDARSPLNFVDRLSCPIIFFQGDEDRVVPPSQAERMVQALREKGLPVAYLLFAGEQHGFRKAENIRRALEEEFFFFAKIFGFEPAERPAAW
jgi:dipeptidyl aminopeptidase/acylaminoacyl peptidase